MILRLYHIRFCVIAALFLHPFPQAKAQEQPNPQIWPQIETTHKPWTRWWWMGSAVDKTGITQQLIAFDKAGIGGVEIEPIYGVQGESENELDYLSPQWNIMMAHTLATADSLGMEVDFTLGTGWPYGGPHVAPKFAATRLIYDEVRVEKGATLEHLCTPLNPNEQKNSTFLSVLAFSDTGTYEDLTHLVQSNRLKWKSKKEGYTLYFVYEGKTGQQVKRAAPGAKGFTLNHYSQEALEAYVQPFEEAFAVWGKPARSIFNDSYEVYDTDFTPNFFSAFKKHRGYDLKPHFALLVDKTDHDLANRVKSDYRETLGDLLLEEFNRPWTAWANNHGMKTKLQAHGSPGNLIDLYGSADIPECETFGSMPYAIEGFRRLPENIRNGDADPVMLKFSSSAAHLAGRPLVSSETFTWLRDHFKTALSQCKPEAEDLLLNGINHIFLHGSTYSPERASWPGWKFYASVNFNPNNTIWRDAPALFSYLARCQSLLQSGKPDNEILLYYPIYDVWDQHLEGELFVPFKIHSLDEWLFGTSFYNTSKKLMEKGYGVDFISDRFIEKATYENGKIQLPGGSYKSLVVPDCGKMPLPILKKLLDLQKAGASIIFNGHPESVPGFHDHERLTTEMNELLTSKHETVSITPDLFTALAQVDVHPESLVASGLKFIRRDINGEKIYFLVNHTTEEVDTFVPLAVNANGAALLDPLTGDVGRASVSHTPSEDLQVRVQIPSGGSLFVQTGAFTTLKPWDYVSSAASPIPLKGVWNVSFMDGGPELPESATLEALKSWTTFGPKSTAFSGTARYEVSFDRPKKMSDAWQLNLGDVRESAKVWLNGKYIGTVWANPFSIRLEDLKEGKNTLVLEVTNLPANRIRAKELRGEEWQIFNEINMVNKDYAPLDASQWDPVPSGLLGPVTLTPLKLETAY